MKSVYRILVIFGFVFLYLYNGVSLVSANSYDMNSPEVKEIASKFSMDGHAVHDISTCNTKQIFFAEIAELLNEGKTKEEIIDSYFQMYGEEGLQAPKKEGFSLFAWITPYIVLGLAGVGLFIGIKNMVAKQTVSSPFQTEAETQSVDIEIAKSVIEEERKKYF